METKTDNLEIETDTINNKIKSLDNEIDAIKSLDYTISQDDVSSESNASTSINVI